MLIGTDGEMFVKKDGSLIPVRGYLGGTKDSPRPTQNGYVQEDGVCAEFNISPASTRDEWLSNINAVINDMALILKENNISLHISAAEVFDFSQLKHPSLLRSGCDPDFNIWVRKQNIAPDFRATPLRSAAGHIHIGGDMDREKMVKAMDLFAGIPSVLMDEDTLRKSLFGKAGCFRHKPYGVEYRTLSNFWLKDDKKILWAFDATERAYKEHLSVEVPREVEDIINSNDKEGALRLVNEFNLECL
jgi:hypothetical protein